MKKFIKLLLPLMLIFSLFAVAIPVYAVDTWGYYLEFTVTDTGGTDRTNVPVVVDISGTNLYDAGYIDSDGLDTRLRENTTDIDYMLADDYLAFVVPSLSANQTRTYRLYMDYAPDITSFNIIAGQAGTIVVSDNAALEPGGSFNFEYSGIIDFNNLSVNPQDNNIINRTYGLTLYLESPDKITTQVPKYLPDEYSSSSDGYVYVTNATYNTAWTATSGTVDDSSATIRLGQVYSAPNYTIYRTALYFDTSSIPAYAEILDATLYIYGEADYSATNFDIWIGSGTSSTYPHDPLAVGDYDKTNYEIVAQSALNTSSFSTSGYNSLAFPENAMSYIIPNGVTKLWLTSSLEGGAPTGNEYISFYSSEQAGTSNDPYIKILYGEPLSISGVSTGTHVIKVYASGGTQTIDVDGTTDSDTMDTNFPDCSSTWGFMEAGEATACPSIDYIKYSVGGSSVLWYQPIAIIASDTIIDRQGTAQNATINIGSNADLAVVIKGISSYESYVSIYGEGTTANMVQPSSMPNDWFASGSGAGLPFYSIFNDAATDMGMPTQSLYVIMMLGVAVAVGLGVLMFTGSSLVAVAACGIAIAAGINTGVLSVWMLFVYIIFGVGILYLARQT